MQQHWELLIGNLYQDFIDFFLPDWTGKIDFSRPATFLKLPKNVVENSPDAMQKNLIVGLRFRDEKPGLLLLTLEEKGYDNEQFAQQLFQDFTATMEELEYKIPTATLVIFLANSLPQTSERYNYEFGQSRLQFNFAQYVVREQYLDDLWEMVNPISFVIAACRLHLENQQHPRGRFESKILITEKLLQRYLRQRINVEAVTTLLQFIVIKLDLNEHWDTIFKDEISAFIGHQSSIPAPHKALILESLRVG